jgi:hypothetical protein
MGVPVVTLVSDRPAGRQSASILQTLDGTVMPRIVGVLLVVAHQAVELVFAKLECAGKIQRDVRRVVCAGLAVLVRPIAELLPLVSAFFR